MIQQIYHYELHLFGQKECISLTQEQGQKLIMLLTTDSSKKFITLGDEMINTSAIESIKKEPSKTYSLDGKQQEIYEKRELTLGEVEMQKTFDEFKNDGKLLN